MIIYLQECINCRHKFWSCLELPCPSCGGDTIVIKRALNDKKEKFVFPKIKNDKIWILVLSAITIILLILKSLKVI